MADITLAQLHARIRRYEELHHGLAAEIVLVPQDGKGLTLEEARKYLDVLHGMRESMARAAEELRRVCQRIESDPRNLAHR